MIRSEIRHGNLKRFRYHHRIRVGDHGDLQRNDRDGERKRDQKIISTAPSVMQIAVTKAVNMAERKEGRERAGPTAEKTLQYSR